MWLRCRKSLQYLHTLGKSTRSPWLMQTCSYSPSKRTKLAPLQERKMIDRFRLAAKGGDGGNGCYSYRRSRHNRRGTPDGGNGGRGGDVILESSTKLWDFSTLQHHINARRGGHGASKNLIGSRGEDKVVLVPVGTVIHLIDGEIPAVVEKSSSTALDPWDMPISTDADQSELISPLTSIESSSSKVELKKDIDTMTDLTTKRKAYQSPSNESLLRVSPARSKTGIQAIEFTLREEGSESELEALATEDEVGSDDEIMEEECEVEMEKEDQVVGEFTEPGQRMIVAQGGNGGLGNVCYQKAFRNRKHGTKEAEKNKVVDDESSEDPDEEALLRLGLPGSQAILLLELKSIADVGLVGMPNAGKSTLLGALSRAKPVVGHYAFTTLRPNLGNVNYEDFSVTVADIPGLIKGAHENRGLGHAFLRHIERTKVLAYVLDLAAALDGRKGVHPWVQLKDLLLELEFYRQGLSKRPSLIVANKIDEEGADEVYEELKRKVSGVPIFPVCAVLNEGVPELRDGLRLLVSGEESHTLDLDKIELD